VLDEISKKLKNIPISNEKINFSLPNKLNKKDLLSTHLAQKIPMYEVDSVLRHSTSLQLTPEASRSDSR
jgi:hypothetical protein